MNIRCAVAVLVDYSMKSFANASLLQVGDIVSVIDMPPKEDTSWWRGKHGFQVCSV